MSLIPNHFKELQIIDEFLGEFMNSKLSFEDKFLYVPNKSNAYYIARTFDINIDNLSFSQSSKLLKSPMLSKSKLGTKQALKDSLTKVFGDVVIQTKLEDKKLKPFEFSIKASIDEGINENTLKAINNIISDIKPLRDNLAGLDFEMPRFQTNINLKTSIQWRL